MTETMSHFGWAFLQTVIVFGVCLAIYQGTKWYLKKNRIKPYKDRLQKLRFILSGLFGVTALFIWIPSFWYIFIVLLFVAGVIAFTQKYNLQNLFGGVMIRWRQLFHEGDIIQISHHLGEVKTIGPFYFVLKEVDLNRKARISGQIVKIPNAFVSKYPLINYSIRKVHKHHLHYIFDKDTSLEQLKDVLDGVLPFVQKALKSSKAEAHDMKDLKISYTYAVKQSAPVGIKATITIHSSIKLLHTIEQAVEKYIIQISQGDNAIKLSF